MREVCLDFSPQEAGWQVDQLSPGAVRENAIEPYVQTVCVLEPWRRRPHSAEIGGSREQLQLNWWRQNWDWDIFRL